MLRELKFVMGAVAKKDFVAAMTHFCIQDGRVSSFNGKLALSSPINFDINCKPKAQTLVKAIAQCEDTITLAYTKAGRLLVKSGSFSASVECTDESTPDVTPSGDPFPVDGAILLDCLKRIEGFIGDDASRPWSNGVLLRGQSAFATNNSMIVEYWLGENVPRSVNIPLDAIKEMLRINEPPVGSQIDETSISFHYADGRWIRSHLLNTEWPDVSRILERDSKPQPMREELFTAIEHLKPFTSKMNEVYFVKGGIKTHMEDGEGASYDIAGFDYDGCYTVTMLLKLKGVAERVDFGLYPGPCTFFGNRLRGVFIGLNKK